VTSYAYDTLNRLSTLTPPTAFSSTGFGFSYDALSRRTQMTRPNGVTTNYTYDNLSRLLSVLHQVSSSTIDGAAYTYDSAGNRTAKTNEKTAVTSNYTYDPLYELTEVTQSTNTTESYSYDPVGNRLSSLSVSSYTNNSSNELTSSSAASYAYDANGNTTSKTVSGSTTTYTWDYENRLSSVVLPGTGGTIAFKYDGLGHRVQKAFTQGSTTTTTNFLYDGANSIADVDQNGNVLARYEQTTNIDEPLAELRSGTTSYYQADGLGSVTSLSSSAGALANTYTYDSFGNLTASTGSVTNRFQYTGREFDSETNLYSYRARYYDPTSSKFTSEDPVRYLGGPNFYPYAKNNPVNLADPRGLSPVCVWLGSTELRSSQSATRRYTSPWTYAFATQDGGPDPGAGLAGILGLLFGSASRLNCQWKRNYVRDVWETTRYLNAYLCIDQLPCGSNLVWFEFNVDTKKRYLGEEPGGTEPTTTSRLLQGYDNSEFLDWMYCNQPNMVPRN
jgi:RHS repeat-associated protein